MLLGSAVASVVAVEIARVTEGRRELTARETNEVLSRGIEVDADEAMTGERGRAAGEGGKEDRRRANDCGATSSVCCVGRGVVALPVLEGVPLCKSGRGGGCVLPLRPTRYCMRCGSGRGRR